MHVRQSHCYNWIFSTTFASLNQASLAFPVLYIPIDIFYDLMHEAIVSCASCGQVNKYGSKFLNKVKRSFVAVVSVLQRSSDNKSGYNKQYIDINY